MIKYVYYETYLYLKVPSYLFIYHLRSFIYIHTKVLRNIMRMYIFTLVTLFAHGFTCKTASDGETNNNIPLSL